MKLSTNKVKVVISSFKLSSVIKTIDAFEHALENLKLTYTKPVSFTQ